MLRKLQLRLQLSRAKHRSLSGHSRMARRFASLVPFYEYGEIPSSSAPTERPEDIAAARRAGFLRLAAIFAERFTKTAALTAEVAGSVSDLQFTSRYRVPFQFSGFVRQHFKAGSFVESSAGVTVTDLDGNRLYDLTGSYGVNVFGYDFYKECIERGAERVRGLGPVLGAYHPVTAYNVRRLLEISGLDEVSFHMSGTEAVMQAVRLARYHTRRTHLVRFCGAYHGWWGDVQPGVGNPLAARETYTLEGHGRGQPAGAAQPPRHRLRAGQSPAGTASERERAGRLHAGRQRARGALRPRRVRRVAATPARGVQRARHRPDLRRGVRRVFGWRLGGAQEYFGVRADMVTYGKTLAGGLPVGRSVRAAPLHAPLPRRPARRYLLRPRHVQFASLRHGCHVRIPDAGSIPRPCAGCIAISTSTWNSPGRRLE